MQNKEPEVSRQTTSKKKPQPNIFNFLSLTERLLVVILGFIFAFTGILLLKQTIKPHTSEIPTQGGTFREIIVGYPQFINPVLANTEADRDLIKLIFSGLIKRDQNGNYVPDLADKYDISEDGKTYTFHINGDAKFHDGSPVTADDVIFTIEKTQSPLLNSPKLANWTDVKVTKKDQQTVVFSLKRPYRPFLTQLTLGILPKHLWEKTDNEQFRQQALNRRPIGSGPFIFSHYDTNSQGQLSHYVLKSFSDYLAGQPFLSELDLNFTTGVNQDQINHLNEAYAGVTPQTLSNLNSSDKILETDMDRVFAIFFNPGEKSALKDAEVRQALALLIDRQAIIKEVLNGHGRPITTAFPLETKDASATTDEEDTNDGDTTTETTEDTNNDNTDIKDSEESEETILAKKIKSLLEKADWEFDEDSSTWKNGKKTLTVTIKIPQVPALQATAKLVAASWNEVGIKTEIESFPVNDFNKDIINTRDYEAIIFGQIVDKHTDLTPLWHSSGRNAPGLNISGYTNTTADKLLEKINQEADEEKLQKEYSEFNQLIAEDVPAIFLYSPNFIYLVPEDIKSIDLGRIRLRDDRFNNIQNWYIKNDRIWKSLEKNK